ncbi:MAG: hypothetical protein MUC51_20070 [Anaerolineae bacterium]|nr:hypothetical protein [Anaerolineae bacterium]
MGISELIFLGYRDSGMVDSAENADPRAYINAPAFLRMRDEMAALEMDTSQFDRFEEGGARGWPDDQVNVVLGCTQV